MYQEIQSDTNYYVRLLRPSKIPEGTEDTWLLLFQQALNDGGDTAKQTFIIYVALFTLMIPTTFPPINGI